MASARDNQLISYYSRGFSMRETAAKMNLSLERVRQILRANAPHLIRPKHVGMSLAPRRRLAEYPPSAAA